jgi:hypothetical protein
VAWWATTLNISLHHTVTLSPDETACVIIAVDPLSIHINPCIHHMKINIKVLHYPQMVAL